jgi:hypothetical protein
MRRPRHSDFGKRWGWSKLAQLARMQRSMEDEARKNPDDSELQKSLLEFRKERAEEELREFQLWAENYPTDSKIRYDVAVRMFALGKFSDAIPVFQHVRQDPKYRTDAGIALGRAFLEAGFVTKRRKRCGASSTSTSIKATSNPRRCTTGGPRAVRAAGGSGRRGESL